MVDLLPMWASMLSDLLCVVNASHSLELRTELHFKRTSAISFEVGMYVMQAIKMLKTLRI